MNSHLVSSTDLNTVPLVPIRDTVVFPETEVILTFGRRQSTLAVASALQSKSKLIALFTQQKHEVNDPKLSDLYRVGTLCVVERTLKNDGEMNVLVRGVSRIHLNKFVKESPFITGEVAKLTETTTHNDDLEAMVRHLTTDFKKAVNLGKPVEFMNFMRLMSGVSAGELIDQIASSLSITIADKQAILETLSINSRAKSVAHNLAHEIKILELERNIASKTQAKFSKNMKDTVLRERMEMIKKELGEDEEEDVEIKDLEHEISKLKIDKPTRKKVEKELDRYSKMSLHNPEANYIRTWLDTIIELPWGKFTTDRVALKTASQVLEEDHYGLPDVKERILEYLSVMKLKKKNTASKGATLPTILCFVGPPGVGKTSIGRSIARALRREFVKVSLGGIRDEAEIRGHRRTYVGAMPGRIVSGVKDADSSNPVFMLDEIDKIGSDHRGDPSSALLEALDPEQNHAFSDHYLDVPYDLSQVMFIATANVLDTIPPALRDRLEIIRFSGYTEIEKYHIAKSHLIPKVRENNALTNAQFKLSKPVITKLIKSYAREAGVRELERQLGRVARKLARSIVDSRKSIKKPTLKNLSDFLGPEKYLPTLREKTHPVGMATGLAWTSVGGVILFIEVSLMPGKGTLKLTGQLGDVMQESAQAAMTYVRSHYDSLGLKKDFYKTLDVHIHVPEGAVPKDGPSAGVTITTALVSALSKKRIHKTLGMTGEITLRGRVLEIGGLKEKVIAAHSAGLREIIFPAGNAKDLVKIPAEIRSKMKFHPVEKVEEVLAIALIESAEIHR